jgi:hypothetical protein
VLARAAAISGGGRLRWRVSSSRAQAGDIRWPDKFRRWAFRFATAFFAFAFCIPSLALLDLVVGLLPAGPESELPAHMGDLAYGVIGVVLISPAFASQVRKPERKAGPLHQVALVILALAMAAAASGAYIGVAAAAVLLMPLAVVVALHPTPLRVFRQPPRPSTVLLVLAMIALAPTTFYAWAMAADGRAERPPEDSYASAPTFWSAVVAVAIATILVALHAALRFPGWTISAACVAVAGLLFGWASILNPGIPASGGRGWGSAAIIWTLIWVSSAVRERASEAR